MVLIWDGVKSFYKEQTTLLNIFSKFLQYYSVICVRPFKHNDNNDNDKRLGLTAQADQSDHTKIQYIKNKIDNKAVQKLHTS